MKHSHVKMYSLIAWLLPMILLSAACKETRAVPEKPSLNLKPTKLATIPPGTEGSEIVFDSLGHHVAYAMVKNGKWRVVIGVDEGKPYDKVEKLTFTPDGRHFTYRAAKSGKMMVVMDGEEGKPYDDVNTAVFSPDGQRFAYDAKRGAKWYVVSEGRESAGSDQPYSSPAFSPDGRVLAYIELDYAKNTNVRVVSDVWMKERKTGGVSDGIGLLVTSTEGGRQAYGVKRLGKFRVVTANLDLSGQELAGPEYDQVSGIAFARDGKKLAYLAEKEGKRLLVIDGREQSYPFDAASQPFFSPDGSRIATIAKKGEKFFVVIDGTAGPLFDEIGQPNFSPDGTRFAYPARQGGAWSLEVNGKPGPPFEMVVAPQFSPDGSRVVYRARKDNKRFVVVADNDGQTVQEHPAYEQVWQPVVAPDGKSVAYGVKAGQELWWKVEPLK